MPRFYYPFPLQTGALIDLPEQLVRHVQVLRLQAGDLLTLFNGEGGQYLAALTGIGKKHASAEIRHFSPLETELAYSITVAQALPEGAKMDWIIEKCVELGASGFQPLLAQRCVVKLAGERAEKRVLHWQAVVAAASEQCGRNRLARIAEPVDFKSWAGQHDLHRRVLLTPRAEQSLASWATHQPPQAVTLVAGPEGGFTEAEEAQARSHGMLPLAMGARVLRTETAAMAALAMLNGLWDRG